MKTIKENLQIYSNYRIMSDRFSDFMKPLKETHFSLKDYVDFPKVAANVEAMSVPENG